MSAADNNTGILAVEADESLRRFMSRRQCASSNEGEVWTVFGHLFFDDKESYLSFHMKPQDWDDADILTYRMAYPSIYEKVPGVLQMHRSLFIRASMSVPCLSDDPDDVPDYRPLHCDWPCPGSIEDADTLADIVTTALAVSQQARVVCKVEKLKNLG
ncbi:MAG: hypothetical protein M9921_13080 [Fimbriimonadaceae bacterium]|nr:hypothetical protein [Fimbriimonadaceae bacterium]